MLDSMHLRTLQTKILTRWLVLIWTKKNKRTGFSEREEDS
jgi:hypothetical protein